jgi:hypothetical protein
MLRCAAIGFEKAWQPRKVCSMKPVIGICTIVVAGIAFLWWGPAVAADAGSKDASKMGKVGKATGGAGSGKIKAPKPALNPQPLPPGVKKTPSGKSSS